MILTFDHVQVSIPAGELEKALDFYIGVLGFTRVPKPADMRQTGAWLTAGQVNFHLGEEEKFVASNLAHPAMRVDNFQELVRLSEQNGLKVRVDNGPAGFLRGSIWDPFGNRIELMQKM